MRKSEIDDLLSAMLDSHDNVSDLNITVDRPLQVESSGELVAVPVSDVDRSKAFYTDRAGFARDVDARVDDTTRFVQLTPPGSACSIAIGQGITTAAAGTVEGLQLVVADVEAARQELLEHGVDVSEVKQFPWGSFVWFSDPDGNGWALQQLPDTPEAGDERAATEGERRVESTHERVAR